MAKGALAVICLLLAACGGLPPPGCHGFRPILPAPESSVAGLSDVDAMSSDLAAQILAHNEFGLKNCGWRRLQRQKGAM